MHDRHSSALSALPPGEHGIVLALHVSEELYHRLAALGLRIGKQVRVLRRASFAGPLHIRIGTTDLMLRAAEASRIRVQPAAA